jgi:predicted permease
MRTALVVAQVAVSLMLLVGAGLVSRSLDNARQTHPGFDPHNVASVYLDVKQNGYDTERGRVFYSRLLETAASDPAIESTALAAFHPLGMTERQPQRITIDGYDPRQGEDLAFGSNVVSPNYFRTVRVPMLAGRDFTERDDPLNEPVVIINQTFAQRFFDGASAAIGRRIRTAEGDWRTVVGVAADLKYSQITEAPRPYFYRPFLQNYRSVMYLHARGTEGADSVAGLVARTRAKVDVLDANQPVLSARPLTEEIRGAFIFMDLAATMLLIFGSAGMALAALGTYGLVSYTVKQRTHEIGIRLALGAPKRAVVLGFLARGLTLGAIGAAAGTVAALAVGGLLRDVLFGVSATDAVSFARALAIVLAGVAIATVVPACRASRTDPLDALRHR